ncbi:MAG: GNAT family N-acetyltransferase [Provencibacterium sp.]|jgi:GNAT superfamily N-acetyltransferase|nr:GNAT family N-acetyltransferase [Provencibacterium sp.]
MESVGMENGICKQVAARPEIRSSFFHLAQKVFGLSFEGWYEAGYWSESYQPYAWVEEGRVVANVSVNRIDLTWQGEPRRYIQLGTVMADPQYRGRGHARRLMETVLEEWRGRCDALYLFANRTVLDFYPKFQFVRAAERQYTLPLRPCARGCRRLDMKREEDRAALLAHYRRSNPYSAFPMVGNGGF